MDITDAQMTMLLEHIICSDLTHNDRYTLHKLPFNVLSEGGCEDLSQSIIPLP
jgi:hypothetical protein